MTHVARLAGLVLMAAAALPAFAQTAAPPPPPVQITATQIAAAKELVVATGLSASFEPLVPRILGQLGTTLTRTRPELTDDMIAIAQIVRPDFDKRVDEIVDVAARIFATRLTEPELRQLTTFFTSPLGKRYVDVQPTVLDEVAVATQAWVDKISTEMTVRVRVEMKKKGHEF